MRPPVWAEALLRMQLEPREEDMIVGDFREEFLDRGGQASAMFWYCRQVAGFRSLFTIAAVWLVVFTGVAISGLWMHPFSPVPDVIACLAIVPLAAMDAARRTGHLRAGLIFGVALGATMFLLGAVTVKTLHLPSPPLSIVPVLPTITIIAFASAGAAAGKRFRNLGAGLDSLAQ